MTPKQKALQHIRSLHKNARMEEILKEVNLLAEGKAKVTKQPWTNTKGRWLFACAAACAIISFFLILSGLDMEKMEFSKTLPAGTRLTDSIIYGLWLLVPPIWFLIEYLWIFPDEDKMDPERNGDFKFTQELSSKFWAALLVFFGLILYLKYGFKP